MARHSLKKLLPEFFTSSNNFESYVTHIELLSHFQKWQRKEKINGAENETGEQPQYFVLRLHYWALVSIIHFRRTLGRAMLRP